MPLYKSILNIEMVVSAKNHIDAESKTLKYSKEAFDADFYGACTITKIMTDKDLPSDCQDCFSPWGEKHKTIREILDGESKVNCDNCSKHRPLFIVDGNHFCKECLE